MTAGTALIDGVIRAGVWHGIVRATGKDAPALEMRHAGGVLRPRLAEPVPGKAGHWRVEVPLPAEMLEDGVQALVVADGADGQTLQVLTIMAGVPPAEDLLAEVASLRAELEVLKAAVRRLARETRGG